MTPTVAVHCGVGSPYFTLPELMHVQFVGFPAVGKAGSAGTGVAPSKPQEVSADGQPVVPNG